MVKERLLMDDLGAFDLKWLGRDEVNVDFELAR